MRNKFIILSAFLTLTGCGSMSFFGGGKDEAPATPKVISSSDREGIRSELCPSVDVRDGAAVYRLTSGGEGPGDVRYQATFTEMARECFIEGNTFRIKIGVEGRVVVGPKGAAGTLTLPVRLALVKGLNTPVWSKLYKVTVPVQMSGGAFVLVENELSFPLPKPEELQAMEVYVGFDPKGDLASVKKKR